MNSAPRPQLEFPNLYLGLVFCTFLFSVKDLSPFDLKNGFYGIKDLANFLVVVHGADCWMVYISHEGFHIHVSRLRTSYRRLYVTGGIGLM